MWNVINGKMCVNFGKTKKFKNVCLEKIKTNKTSEFAPFTLYTNKRCDFIMLGGLP